MSQVTLAQGAPRSRFSIRCSRRGLMRPGTPSGSSGVQAKVRGSIAVSSQRDAAIKPSRSACAWTFSGTYSTDKRGPLRLRRNHFVLS